MTDAERRWRVRKLVSPEVEHRSERFYLLSSDGQAITCLECGHTSHEPGHVRDKFCPRCLVFHADRELMVRLAEGYEHSFEASQKNYGIRVEGPRAVAANALGS